jgi:hypothetical protein
MLGNAGAGLGDSFVRVDQAPLSCPASYWTLDKASSGNGTPGGYSKLMRSLSIT